MRYIHEQQQQQKKVLLNSDPLAEVVPKLKIVQNFHFSTVKRIFFLRNAGPAESQDSRKDVSLI